MFPPKNIYIYIYIFTHKHTVTIIYLSSGFTQLFGFVFQADLKWDCVSLILPPEGAVRPKTKEKTCSHFIFTFKMYFCIFMIAEKDALGGKGN